MDLGHRNSEIEQALTFLRDVVHFERRAERRAGRDPERFAVADPERGAVDVELGLMISEHVAGCQPHRVAIERLRRKQIANRVSDEGHILDHGSILAT